MSKRFDFIETRLTGLYRVERKKIEDERGFFSRFFCSKEFKEIGCNFPIAQMNHTMTSLKGSIRGMHFQFPPRTETKIVSCVQGEVWDIAIDIRKGSPTFLHWHAEILSEDNQTSLYIPDGFAHGFQAMTNGCQLLYLHSTIYVPDLEGGLNVIDPRLAIDWPLAIEELSERDSNWPMLTGDFLGIDMS